MKRRPIFLLWMVAFVCGCSSWDLHTVRSQSPEEGAESDAPPRLVGDLASPFGMFPAKVEAVGLVTGLQGTGSDPEPSAQRSMLLEEMQRRGVKNASQLLASGNVSLVLVRGILRPGIQAGDRFDLEVRIPGRSETTSLRGGYLLETRLTDTAVVEGRPFEGKLRALGHGAVLVDPTADEKKDRVLTGRGRILGGAVALQPRSLGLVLKPGRENVLNSARIANAIDRRFHTFHKGVKIGVAKAKTDKYIDLIIHPRYKENIDRYMQVLRAVALNDSPSEMSSRMTELEERLLEPSTAAQAAMQLEALGNGAVDTLLKGVQSPDREVRFFAAEALAYLDRREAAEPLAEAAKNEPAFRVYALGALGAMGGTAEFAAYEKLHELLNVASVETRYGAFRALSTMNSDDALVKGEKLGGQFSYHLLDTPGPALIHVTRNRRAEVVLFGLNQKLATPLSVNAGNHIMLNSTSGEEITVSKFSAQEADQKRTVSTRVDDVLRAIVDLGGTYPDVVQALQEAKATGALESRFEVDALPEAGRTFDRMVQGEDAKAAGDSAKSQKDPAKKDPASDDANDDAKKEAKKTDSKDPQGSAVADDAGEKKSPPRKGIFAKMLGRDAQ